MRRKFFGAQYDFPTRNGSLVGVLNAAMVGAFTISCLEESSIPFMVHFISKRSSFGFNKPTAIDLLAILPKSLDQVIFSYIFICEV